MEMSSYLLEYPFHERLFPGVKEALRHVEKYGTTAILSDGDVVFQPRKVHRSGLHALFEGKIMIFLHKESQLDYVEKHYPARHYVMIDDKVRLLDAIKKQWGEKVTTVFPRQGHYALDSKTVSTFPPPDITIEKIGDLINLDWQKILSD